MQRNSDFPKSITQSLDSDLIDVLSTWDGVRVFSTEERTKIKKIIEMFPSKDKDEKASSTVQCKNLYGIGASFTLNEVKTVLDKLLHEPKEEKSDAVVPKAKAEVVLVYSYDEAAKEFPERVICIIKMADQVYCGNYSGIYGPIDSHNTEELTRELFELNHYISSDHSYPLAFRVIGIADGDVYPAESVNRFPKAEDVLANLKMIKEAKINVAYASMRNTSPLERAFMSGNPDAVEFLLQKGADPYYCDRIALNDFACTDKLQKLLATSLLMGASKRGLSEDVRHILATGVAVDAIDPVTKGTALHKAAGGNQVNVMGLLLQHHADIEARTSMGFTPLHFAARYNCVYAAQLLINQKANIEAMADDRITPLHLAISSGSLAVAAYLIEQGADLFAISSSGDLPFAYANGEAMRKLLAEEMLKIAININDAHLVKYIVQITGKSSTKFLSKIDGYDDEKAIHGSKISAEMRQVLIQEKLRLQMTTYRQEKEGALKGKNWVWKKLHGFTAKQSISAVYDMLDMLEDEKPLELVRYQGLFKKSHRLKEMGEELKNAVSDQVMPAQPGSI